MRDHFYQSTALMALLAISPSIAAAAPGYIVTHGINPALRLEGQGRIAPMADATGSASGA